MGPDQIQPFCKGGEEMEIGRQGLQSMHLNNASMFKKWPHGWGSDRVQLCSFGLEQASLFSFGHFVRICLNGSSESLAI